MVYFFLGAEYYHAVLPKSNTKQKFLSEAAHPLLIFLPDCESPFAHVHADNPV